MPRYDSSSPVFPSGGAPQGDSQRPAMRPLGQTAYLFHHVGSTGWNPRRDITNHKGEKKEGDFSHLHRRFSEEEE